MKFEVYLKRKESMNAYQGARKKVAYVTASTAEEAKALALIKHPEFIINGTPRRML